MASSRRLTYNPQKLPPKLRPASSHGTYRHLTPSTPKQILISDDDHDFDLSPRNEEIFLACTNVHALQSEPATPENRRRIRREEDRIARLEALSDDTRPRLGGSAISYPRRMASGPASAKTESPSYPRLSSPANNYGGVGTSASAALLNSPLPHRKRDHGTHLDGGDGESQVRIKSRRASPSPTSALTSREAQPRPFASPIDFFNDFESDDMGDFIDLTGDDDRNRDDIVAEQAQLFKQIEAENARKKADEDYARRLNDDSYEPPRPPQQPAASNSGPNAFERMYRPPSQVHIIDSSPSQSPLAQSPPSQSPPSHQQQIYSRLTAIANGNVPAAEQAEMPAVRPSHSSFNARMMGGASAMNHFGGSGPKQENKYETKPFTSNSLSNYSSYAAGSSQHPSRSAADVAREAARARYSAAMRLAQTPSTGTSSPYGHNISTGSPWDMPGAWPGSSQVPSYTPPSYQAGPSYHNDPFAGLDLANLDSEPFSMRSIINNTSQYNFDTMTDGMGNLLPAHLRSYAMDVAEDPRKTAEEINELLSNIRPDMDIPEEDRLDTPDGLRYPLYTHQKLALQWMMTSEKSKNRGGILADDMGLGKTVSTLALLLSHPAPADSPIKTNLIVGPVALIKQWETEVAKKIKSTHSLSVYLLHGKKSTFDELRHYDVVLTSYGKIAAEKKRYDTWVAVNKGVDPTKEKELAAKCPLVHPASRFYRVILDEAQCIKNVNTQAAKGACAINSKYRWCLTGTPMMNSTKELFSLIQFLGIAPYNKSGAFSKAFSILAPRKNSGGSERQAKAAMEKLRILLKAIMLRRMKNSMINGKPILELPVKTIQTKHAVFSEDEMNFYTDLESQTATKVNKYLREGTIGKNYSNVLLLLLRLRQACCHPHLNLDVQHVGAVTATTESMADLALTIPAEVVERLKREVHPPVECTICYDPIEDPAVMIPCGHNTCFDCLASLTDQSAQRAIQAGFDSPEGATKCPECRGPISMAKVIPFSAFRKTHMPESEPQKVYGDGVKNEDDVSTASDTDSGSDSDEESDEEADRNGNLKGFIVNDDDVETASEAGDKDEDEDGLPSLVPSGVKKEGSTSTKVDRRLKKKSRKDKSKDKSKGKGKGKEKEKVKVQAHMLKDLRVQARKNKKDHRRYMRYLHKNWQDSAKVTECCDIIKAIQESGEKTIVFSQFTMLLDLLEVPLKHQVGVQYGRYDGSMSRTQRDATLAEFTDPNSRTKVLLVSLKAGNAGLNLTTANHVVLMDPFWNPYIEAQAIDRAHRIGQQREVHVHRILVENTVEDRIIALQEQKRQLVENALDEKSSQRLSRLTTKELAFLFNIAPNAQ